MVLQEILTILFATGAGVAVVIYASRPKHRIASSSPSMIGGSSAGDSFQSGTSAVEVVPQTVSVIETQPSTETTVIETAPVVHETSGVAQQEVSQISVGEVTHTMPMSFDPVTVPGVTAVPSIPESIEPSSVNSQVEATASVVEKVPRAQRRRSGTSTGKTRARTSQRKKDPS